MASYLDENTPNTSGGGTSDVNVVSSVLPTGASTAAKQTAGNTSLASIDGKLTDTANGLKVDGSGVTQPVSISGTVPVSGSVSVSNFPATQPVSGTVTANAGTGDFTVVQATAANLNATVSGTVTANAGSGTMAVSAASLPLPTGASTSALQTTGNTSLSSIDTKTPALGQALAAASVPVVLPAAQITTLTPPTTVTVTQGTGTNLHTVVDSGTVTATISGTPTISGTVSVSNFPATQPVSGTVAATQSGTWTVQPGNTANTTAWKVDGSAVTQPVSGTVTANAGTGNFTVAQATGTNLHTVVDSGSVTATISGTPSVSVSNFPATQPVSGTVTANAGTGTFTVGQATAANLNATVVGSGNFTVVQPTGTNLHTVIDSGTTAVTQATASSLNATIVGSGPASPGTAQAGSVLIAGVYNSTKPSPTNGQQLPLQQDSDGSLLVNIADVNAANLIVSTTAASGTGVTATLPAVAGQFHYITGIEINKYYAAAVTGTATAIVSTSTNLPGPVAFTFETAGAIGTMSVQAKQFTAPIRSSVVNTASTIVLPATTSIIWRVNVYYYTAP